MHTAGKGGQVDQSLMDTIGFVVQNRLEMHQHQFRERKRPPNAHPSADTKNSDLSDDCLFLSRLGSNKLINICRILIKTPEFSQEMT